MIRDDLNLKGPFPTTLSPFAEPKPLPKHLLFLISSE